MMPGPGVFVARAWVGEALYARGGTVFAGDKGGVQEGEDGSEKRDGAVAVTRVVYRASWRHSARGRAVEPASGANRRVGIL